MLTERVLLVCLGVLGDLAWRKFIKVVRQIENSEPNIELLLVDIPWNESNGLDTPQELRWRMARRRVEHIAEQIAAGKVAGLNLNAELSRDILPWEGDQFFDNGYLDGAATIREQNKLAFQGAIEDWLKYFLGSSTATRLPRYAADITQVYSRIQRLKSNGWKVVVYAATPPQAYNAIINQWRVLADRIVLEKPAGGLDPDSLEYLGADSLRQAAASLPQSCQLVVNDHYNAKSMVRMLNRFADFGLFKDILSPARINRVVLQLLEPAPIPLGRCSFYIGAGGVFGDMAPHIIQIIRALFGLSFGLPRVEFTGKFCWGRYEAGPQGVAPLQVRPYCYEPDYYRALDSVTETFVAFEAQIKIEGHPDIPLFCRTGKGIQFERKTLRVDATSDANGSELSFLFNFTDNTFAILNDEKGFVLASGPLTITDAFESGVPSMSWEYQGIFETLISSRWESNALDSRYFPSIADAAESSDRVFEKLLKERSDGSRIVASYSPKKPSTQTGILNFLDDQAHWD